MRKTAPVILAALSATIAVAEAAALAVYAPRPNYPYEVRARHLQGSGIAIVTIDPATGYATNAVMAVSTGVPALDEAATTTFRRWRFKPGTVSKVRIPINFVLSGGGCFSRRRGSRAEGAADESSPCAVFGKRERGQSAYAGLSSISALDAERRPRRL